MWQPAQCNGHVAIPYINKINGNCNNNNNNNMYATVQLRDS